MSCLRLNDGAYKINRYSTIQFCLLIRRHARRRRCCHVPDPVYVARSCNSTTGTFLLLHRRKTAGMNSFARATGIRLESISGDDTKFVPAYEFFNNYECEELPSAAML